MYTSIEDKQHLNRDLWIEVDLSAIAHNMRVIRALSRSPLISAVVKADGYGHGAVAVGRTLLENGADRFAVATADEAYELREAFPDTPILILSEVDVHLAPVLAQKRIAVTVTTPQKLLGFHQVLCDSGYPAHRPDLIVHIKVDTGMGRIGCEPSETVVSEWEDALNRILRSSDSSAARLEPSAACGDSAACSKTAACVDPSSVARACAEIAACTETGACSALADGVANPVRPKHTGKIEIEGVFSHFAKADDADKSFSHLQAQRFLRFVKMLAERGIHPPLRHMSNSAAIMELPEYHFDMVRAGILMFGMTPTGEKLSECLKRRSRSECADHIGGSGHIEGGIGQGESCGDIRRDGYAGIRADQEFKADFALRPALSIKSRAIFVKKIEEDMGIGYSHSFVAPKGSTIVTVPAGYADGISRLLSNKMEVLIRGKRCRQVGNICMDHLMVLADETVKTGDEIILCGSAADFVRDPERSGECTCGSGKCTCDPNASCDRGDDPSNDGTPSVVRKSVESGYDPAVITVEEIAAKMGTLNYEIICMLSKRIPRVYLK